ncbi:MAG: YajQ family cyclic di-GMP-binding protein [Chitinophagaceae bacterium]|nr:YajQ family cyclic di-GMP-binding protein [Chitinophagaceae bacterium]
MPSFDIVSRVEIQLLDNAVNVTLKEITNRFDFRDSPVSLSLDKKQYIIHLEAADEMKVRQVCDVLLSKAGKQGISPQAFDFSAQAFPSGKIWKKEIKVKNGLSKEDAKQIVKLVKDTGLKVQASIQDDFVRVTGKKIDDLQSVISVCRQANLGIPLQYVNMRG